MAGEFECEAKIKHDQFRPVKRNSEKLRRNIKEQNASDLITNILTEQRTTGATPHQPAKTTCETELTTHSRTSPNQPATTTCETELTTHSRITPHQPATTTCETELTTHSRTTPHQPATTTCETDSIATSTRPQQFVTG